MKKFIALLLCALMVLVLAACGKGQPAPETQPTKKPVNGPTSVDEAITLSMNAQWLRDKAAYQTAIPDDVKTQIETANGFTFDDVVTHICKGVDMGSHMTMDWSIVTSSACTADGLASLKTKLAAYGMDVDKLGKADEYALLLTATIDGVEETMDLNTVVFEYEGRFFTMYLIEDVMGRVPFMNIGER